MIKCEDELKVAAIQ